MFQCDYFVDLNASFEGDSGVAIYSVDSCGRRTLSRFYSYTGDNLFQALTFIAFLSNNGHVIHFRDLGRS